jgi:hypothetical protein
MPDTTIIPCGITCFIAAVIVAAMVIMTFFISMDEDIQAYESTMSPELRQIYRQIVQERRSIFYTGYTIGIVASIMFLLFSSKFLGSRLSTTNTICSVVAISFIVNHMYYMLSPKTDYMVNHLNNRADREQWLLVYRRMQLYFHSAFGIGLVAVGVLGYAFC